MNKYLQASGIVLILSGCGGEYAAIQDSQNITSADGVGPFYACFDEGYHKSIKIPELAYQQGKCFMDLAKGDNLLGQSIFNELEVGADQHTLLQYAYSWYTYAAEKGHALATYSLGQNQDALLAFDQQINAPDDASSVMFAYESKFHSLDSDRNGSITFAEAKLDLELSQSFAKTDINEDGRLSLGEYIVYSSEATAAGVEGNGRED